MFGQLNTDTGSRPDENHVSSTSVSCVILYEPQCAHFDGSLRATVILWHTGQCHAGMRCPHHSCREMHQSWMFSIQPRYVFSYISGTKRIAFFPSASGFTAAMALSASG